MKDEHKTKKVLIAEMVDLRQQLAEARCQLAEAESKTPDLKAVAITGYAMEEDLQRLREEGFVDTIHKPFDLDTLAAKIRQALDSA